MMTVKTAEDTREEILEAAKRRFSQFGYNKTTMAEIAADCDMSAANIYRFFESKLEMGSCLASKCLDEKVERLRAIVDNKGFSASARIEGFILEMLYNLYEKMEEQPRMDEMVQALCNENRDLIHNFISAKSRLLAELIAEGNQTGEFGVEDIVGAVDAILTATVAFSTPFFIHMFPRDVFEAKARNVANLILVGLRKR